MGPPDFQTFLLGKVFSKHIFWKLYHRWRRTWTIVKTPLIYYLDVTQTMISIRAVAKKLNDQGGRNTQKHRGRRDFFIYLRMFSVLSFNWIFGILTLAIPDNGDIYVLKCWVDLSFDF